MFWALKQFTLTTFSVLYNTAPIMTVFFGAVCLKEKVGISEYVTVSLGFLAVVTIIYGVFIQKQQVDLSTIIDTKKDKRKDHFTMVAFICLILTPFFASLNTILLRKLRKINESTLSCYSNIAAAFMGLFIVNASGMDTSFVARIIKTQPLTTFLFIFTGSITVPQ